MIFDSAPGKTGLGYLETKMWNFTQKKHKQLKLIQTQYIKNTRTFHRSILGQCH